MTQRNRFQTIVLATLTLALSMGIGAPRSAGAGEEPPRTGFEGRTIHTDLLLQLAEAYRALDEEAIHGLVREDARESHLAAIRKYRSGEHEAELEIEVISATTTGPRASVRASTTLRVDGEFQFEGVDVVYSFVDTGERWLLESTHTPSIQQRNARFATTEQLARRLAAGQLRDEAPAWLEQALADEYLHVEVGTVERSGADVVVTMQVVDRLGRPIAEHELVQATDPASGTPVLRERSADLADF